MRLSGAVFSSHCRFTSMLHRSPFPHVVALRCPGGALPDTLWHNSVAMLGDAVLFQRSDSVEAAWDMALPILDIWQPLPGRQS